MEAMVFGNDETMIAAVNKVLHKNFRITVFTDFHKCIDAVNEKSYGNQVYDLFFLDLDMPDSGALKILKKIRTIEEDLNQHKRRVFLFSKDAGTCKAMDFFSGPGDIFLEKPRDEKALKRYLEKYQGNGN